VSLQSEVDLSVPSSISLKWESHSTFSTHVSKGSLAISGGTRSLNSWNSGNSSSGTPRLSGVLHTSISVNSVSLSRVSGDVVVDVLDDVLSQSTSEDVWEFHFLDDLLFRLKVIN
jgi:uncharacterized membrane-anchored protein